MSVIAVAICALGSSGDEEARALTQDLGGVVYETRLKLAQPLPIVLLRTSDEPAAVELVRKLRARGHDAVALDEDTTPEPVLVRTFRFGDTAFERDEAALAYGDVLALVRAALVLRAESVEKITERKLRPAAALATGGLVLTKKVTREEKHVTHDREDLLYVIPTSGAAPWLVSEHQTQYGALEDVALTQHQNFARVVAELRARAPSAVYDERLLAHRHVDDRHALDLRAQMLGVAIARKGTYR